VGGRRGRGIEKGREGEGEGEREGEREREREGKRCREWGVMSNKNNDNEMPRMGCWGRTDRWQGAGLGLYWC
jgi:hypothetical protein